MILFPFVRLTSLDRLIVLASIGIGAAFASAAVLMRTLPRPWRAER